ncbi:MAG: DUF502 domain-containing protein [Bacillota bacterium]|nr:DUF502 domain-containing protein [Bacillota bacterium]
MKSKVWRRVRTYFLAGLATWVPLVVTLYVLKLGFVSVDNLLGGLVARYTAVRIPGLGLILTGALILLTGMVTTNYLGRQVVHLWESLLARIPLVRSIYLTTKQMISVVTSPKEKSFQRVALLQFPRPGSYALVFVTGEGGRVWREKLGEEMVWVFLPTTPNPTTGFLLLVPQRELIPLDLNIEESFQIVVSGGLVKPERLS